MLKADVREVCRYLGIRGQKMDPALLETIGRSLEALTPLLTPREVHRSWPLKGGAGLGLSVLELPGGQAVKSRSLSRALKGCTQVVLLAATIGFGPERLSKRASAAGKMSEALIVSAAGSVLIEAYCDEVCERIRLEAASSGLYPRPRFSPGYGDLPLSYQRELFRSLGVTKNTGITLTEQLLMLPEKSVTAIVGLSPVNSHCPPAGCEACSLSGDCLYRRA